MFAAIREGVPTAGRVVDAISLKTRSRSPALLASLLGATVAFNTAGEYARTIKEAAQHRELIDLCDQVRDGAFGGVAPRELTAKLCAAFDRIAAGDVIDRAVTLDAAMDAAIAAMQNVLPPAKRRGSPPASAHSTGGWGGLEPGLVYVIAGRPGIGKSSLGHQIAVNAARNGVGVLELSLEMSATQLGRRTIATAARVPIGGLKSGAASRDILHSNNIVGRPAASSLGCQLDDR